MTKNGAMVYSYDAREVRAWMKLRNCRITAADAAEILSTSRDEIRKYSGVISKEVRTKGYKGRLIIDNAHNIYMWVAADEEKQC